MNVYFLAKELGKNYLEDKNQYSNLCNGNFHHIVYNYWILKNTLKNSSNNIFLVNEVPKQIQKNDIVIFHYDTKNFIETGKYITVQVIGDFPKLEHIDYYITHNTLMEDFKHIFIHFPLPVSIKKFNPVFPPADFTCVGSKHSINKEILKDSFINSCKDYGINLYFETSKNYASTNTDVFIFLRDKMLSTYKKDNGDILHPSSIWSPIQGKTHRHANRIYQAWYMNTPCIHNKEISIEAQVKSKFDILFAETPDELFKKMVYLRNNKELYFNMIDNCKKRSNENSYSIITNQYLNMFRRIQHECS